MELTSARQQPALPRHHHISPTTCSDRPDLRTLFQNPTKATSASASGISRKFLEIQLLFQKPLCLMRRTLALPFIYSL